MSATNHTPNLELSQFIPLDKPAWLGDYNSDMSKIDTAVHKVQTQADSMETAVDQATTAAQAATQAAQAATEAAQDAADKAQNAETTANNVSGSATQALTIAQQAQADVAKKVSKTGDIMTGMLAFGSSNNGISGKVVVLRTDTDKTNVALDGSNHLRIKKIMDPVDNQDAATKAYVDAHGGGSITPELFPFAKISTDLTSVTGAILKVTPNYYNGAGYLISGNNSIASGLNIFSLTLDTNWNPATSYCYLLYLSDGKLITAPLTPNVMGHTVNFQLPTTFTFPANTNGFIISVLYLD